MSTVHGIYDYSDKYGEYGKKVLTESAAILEKSGIKVFPQNTDSSEKSVTSCVIKKLEDNVLKSEPESKSKKKTNNKENKNPAAWIREAMPSTSDNMSGFSTVKSTCFSEMGDYMEQVDSEPESESEDDDDDKDDTMQDMESSASNIDKLSDASDDEGEGNLLQTFFEKEVPKGFYSSNYAGTKYEKDYLKDSYKNNVTMYSDNIYGKGNLSAIFGGTAKLSFSESRNENTKKVDYNFYSYTKYKAKKLTYGAGVMDTKSNNVNNVNISFGAKHNETGLYAIIQKKLNKCPGMPTHTETNINVGIGKASGLLDPGEHKRSNDEETIDESASQFVEGKESKVFDPEDKSLTNETMVNLIIQDTNASKKYGIKIGRLLKYETKKENYAMVLPYGQISNTNTDSKEGAELILGVNAGQNTNTASGWNLKTKGVLEVSRQVQQGQSPSDYVLANINFKAAKKGFSGEMSAGAYIDNSAYCKYVEAKVDYEINKNLKVSAKANKSHYKFSTSEDENNFLQFVAGVNYSF